jgi:hypothetical protein
MRPFFKLTTALIVCSTFASAWPKLVTTDYTSPSLVTPVLIAAGPDGALWFTDASRGIGRITTSGAITLYPVPTQSSQPWGIVAGPDGGLWFTEFSANQIARSTTAGVVTEYPIPTANSGPRMITLGPDGALWFTEETANKIGRIDTSGAVTEYPIPTVSSSPEGIVTGPDGALWFAEYKGNKIGRITTGGVFTEYTTTLSPMVVGLSYAQGLSATGGTPPYSWSVASGSLPAGLELAGLGIIQGAPTVAGTQTFTLRLTDATSVSTTQTLSLTVNPANCTIRLAPAGRSFQRRAAPGKLR